MEQVASQLRLAALRPGRARSALAWLVGIVVLALALRLPALYRGLPCSPESDAVIVKQAVFLEAVWNGQRPPTPALNRQYPPLLGLTLAALPGQLIAKPSPGPLEQQLADAAQPYRRGRWMIVVIGLCVVPLTFVLARRALGSGWALIASALVATSTLHALCSTQVRPHGALATFVVLALCALAQRLRSGGAWSALAAGCACALSVACLHNGFAVLAPLFAVELARMRRERRWFVPSTLLVLAPVVCAALLSYPDLFGLARPYDFEVRGAGDHVNLSGHMMRIEDFNGAGFGLVPRYLALQDPGLLLLGSIGALLAALALARGGWRSLFVDGREEVLVMVVFGASYALAIGVYARTFSRFVLPLVPLLAIVATFALRTTFAARTGRSRGLLALVLLLVAAPVARVAWTWTRPTTVEQLASWARSTLPNGARIALPIGFDVPIALDVPRVRRLPAHLYSPWTEHLMRDANVALAIDGPVGFMSGRVPGSDQLDEAVEGVIRSLYTHTDAQYVVVLPEELRESDSNAAESCGWGDRGPASRAAGPRGGADGAMAERVKRGGPTSASEDERESSDRVSAPDSAMPTGAVASSGGADADPAASGSWRDRAGRGAGARDSRSDACQVVRRRPQHGHRPPADAVPLARFASGSDDETLDPAGDALDDWTFARFWSVRNLGPELAVYREWERAGRPPPAR